MNEKCYPFSFLTLKQKVQRRITVLPTRFPVLRTKYPSTTLNKICDLFSLIVFRRKVQRRMIVQFDFYDFLMDKKRGSFQSFSSTGRTHHLSQVHIDFYEVSNVRLTLSLFFPGRQAGAWPLALLMDVNKNQTKNLGNHLNWGMGCLWW